MLYLVLYNQGTQDGLNDMMGRGSINTQTLPFFCSVFLFSKEVTFGAADAREIVLAKIFIWRNSAVFNKMSLF
jgi:hypothetical protein